MNQCALITGASSGIGEALAVEHAKRGGNLVIVARRRDRLETLKKTLESQYSGVTIHVVVQDLGENGAAQKVYDAVQDLGLTIDILINNAGLGLHGYFHEQPWEKLQNMLKVNIETLTHLTHLFLPQMLGRGRGAIMNVSSIAGFVPGPLEAQYFATKAYVLFLSEALANEVKDAGVTVTALCPGFTKTEFFEVGNMEGALGPRLWSMSAEEVAQYGYRCMERGKRVAVPGLVNKLLSHVLIRLTPRFFNLSISRKLMSDNFFD